MCTHTDRLRLQVRRVATAAEDAADHHPDLRAGVADSSNGMDTSHGPRYRIGWSLEVWVAAANWPDYTETLELKVESERAHAT